MCCILGNVVLIICFFWGCFFKKSVKTAVPDVGNRNRALVLTKLVEWYRFEVGREQLFFVIFCDLQMSRHLQKSRVTERHNRGTKRNLKSH